MVNLGNTVIVIEHNLDVIACADWIIDLGPEGGDGGGEIIVAGTPEDVAKNEDSYTGQISKTKAVNRSDDYQKRCKNIALATEKINLQVKRLPASPGVYIMKDISGSIIYIGKAKNLQKRVSSYFSKQSAAISENIPHQNDNWKTSRLVGKIHDVDFILNR